MQEKANFAIGNQVPEINKKKTTHPMEKWAQDINGCFAELKRWKRCMNSLILRKIQIKTPLRYVFPHVQLAKTPKSDKDTGG